MDSCGCLLAEEVVLCHLADDGVVAPGITKLALVPRQAAVVIAIEEVEVLGVAA